MAKQGERNMPSSTFGSWKVWVHVCAYIHNNMGVSKNNGTQKWMVYNGKPYQNGWFGGTPIFGNTHIYICIPLYKDSLGSNHSEPPVMVSEEITVSILDGIIIINRYSLTLLVKFQVSSDVFCSSVVWTTVHILRRRKINLYIYIYKSFNLSLHPTKIFRAASPGSFLRKKQSLLLTSGRSPNHPSGKPSPLAPVDLLPPPRILVQFLWFWWTVHWKGSSFTFQACSGVPRIVHRVGAQQEKYKQALVKQWHNDIMLATLSYTHLPMEDPSICA